jgi:hypothetical protein
MARSPDQTVWFSKDSILSIVLSIPVWGGAGLIWGLLMATFMGGSLLGGLLLGLLWGASVWFFFAIYLLVAYRELSTTIPLQETAALPEQLAKAVKPLRYKVEQQSAISFVCKPNLGLARLFELGKLHVRLHQGSIEMVGPAIVVNRVRKHYKRAANPAN